MLLTVLSFFILIMIFRKTKIPTKLAGIFAEKI